ncbi:MAG: 3-phosphoshikimate 1-carboxyvinyltransferase [Phycisphaerales bacterium]
MGELAGTLSQDLAALPARLALRPPNAGGNVSVRPPGSKSLTNRAVLLAALAPGVSRVRGALLDAEDAKRMAAALEQLGARIAPARDASGDLLVTGVDGCWQPRDPDVVLDLGNAGTATRFLAAAALLSPVPVTLDGNARMRQRPIGELGQALERLGATIEYRGTPGFPPMRITPPRDLALTGRVLELGTTQSSQFISALLLVAPWLPSGMTIKLSGEVTSPSYITMTLGLLARLGASVRASDDLRVLRVGAGGREGVAKFDYPVEPDASGATYFWGAGAIRDDLSVRVEGLGVHSLQGDASFPSLLERMGATVTRAAEPAWTRVSRAEELKALGADMTDMPDAAMTLAAVACFAGGRSVIKGLRTLRVKETDRIAAMITELSKIGVAIGTMPGDDGAIYVEPPKGGVDCSESCPEVEFDTYDDHRMAMSLALVSLRRPNVVIKDPACVAKTYPTFWKDFARLHGAATEEHP